MDEAAQGLAAAWQARLRRWRDRALLALACLLLALGGRALGLGNELETAITDAWHRQAGVRTRPQHVALVVIDERTLDLHDDTPLVFWTRQVAQASRVLREAGVAAIGLDLMFSVSPERWLRRLGAQALASDHDRELREEIAHGQLIMVASATQGPLGNSDLLLPSADLVLSVPDLDLARHVGLADVVSDPDGAVRRFPVAPVLRLPQDSAFSAAPRLGLAALLAWRASASPVTAPLTPGQPLHIGESVWETDGRSPRIAFAGPPGTVPRLSMADLLSPGAERLPAVRALKGKVVIIGTEYRGMNDLHATPYTLRWLGPHGAYMSGAELQAQVVEQLLSGRRLPDWPVAASAATIAVLLALAVPLFGALPLKHLAWSFPVLCAGAAALAWQLHLRDAVFPLFTAWFALGLYLLASLAWRVLGEEAERRRVQALFGRYVSKPVVEQLVATGETPPLGGSRQVITVLFCDIRHFTTLSERLQAEEVVEMLNRYFSLACEAVLGEGGTLDKFIGDGIMAEFGTPLAQKDHADRALRCALALVQAAEQFDGWMKMRFTGRDLPRFEVGVGMHTGPAVVGSIGSEHRSDYTAVGDTVNAAARIESWTKELRCRILLSAQTLAAATGCVQAGPPHQVQVKGRHEPLHLHELMGWESAPDAPGGGGRGDGSLEGAP